MPLEEIVTFNVGDGTRKCVDITILDDNIEEGELAETFSVQLVSTTPPSEGVTVDFDLVTISIIDSDSTC